MYAMPTRMRWSFELVETSDSGKDFGMIKSKAFSEKGEQLCWESKRHDKTDRISMRVCDDERDAQIYSFRKEDGRISQFLGGSRYCLKGWMKKHLKFEDCPEEEERDRVEGKGDEGDSADYIDNKLEEYHEAEEEDYTEPQDPDEIAVNSKTNGENTDPATTSPELQMQVPSKTARNSPKLELVKRVKTKQTPGNTHKFTAKNSREIYSHIPKIKTPLLPPNHVGKPQNHQSYQNSQNSQNPMFQANRYSDSIYQPPPNGAVSFESMKSTSQTPTSSGFMLEHLFKEPPLIKFGIIILAINGVIFLPRTMKRGLHVVALVLTFPCAMFTYFFDDAIDVRENEKIC